MKNKHWKIVRTNLFGPTVDIEDFEENLIAENIELEKAIILVQEHNKTINEVEEKDGKAK